MTSRSSSWTKMQKVMFKQRAWVFAVTFLTYVIMHIAIPTMILANRRHEWKMGTWEVYSSSGKLMDYGEVMRQTALAVFAHKSMWVMASMPVIALAVLLAFQGFAWLNSRRQIDFYESQPISRNRHFWQVVISSFLIFIISYLVTLAIGGLIVTAMGAYSNELVIESFRLFTKMLYLFAGYFSISMLAVMLTGHAVVGMLAAAVFFLYETALRGMIIGLMQSYYKTFGDQGYIVKVWTAPIYWIFSDDKYSWIKGLLLVIAVFAIAYICYKIRKNEDAGEAVLYKPVRIVAKIAVSMLIGLFTAWIFSSTASIGIVTSVIIGVVSAVLVGCIMESIYAFDVRAAMKGWGWSLIGAAGAAVLFASIAMDLTGYDTWVPDPDKVEDAYIVDPMYAYRAANENFAKNYMHLTDIEAVNELLKVGEAIARGEITDDDMMQWAADSEEPSTEIEILPEDQVDFTVFPLEIHYRMKNGRDIARSIQLSNTMGIDLADPIIGSAEFREGYFQIYHNDTVEQNLDKMNINGYLINSDYEEVPAEDYYEELKEAYEKDLEKFSWSYATGTEIIGEFSIVSQERYTDELAGIYSPEYVVYEGFDNTIKVLQKAGIFPEDLKGDTDRDYGNWIQGPFGIDSGY